MSQTQPEAKDGKDPSVKVKNTFLEFPIPTEDNDPGAWTRRRCRSDDGVNNPKHSPLVVASKSPIGSPQLQPVDETMQAVPIDEVDFELLEEAASVDGDAPVPSRSRYPDGGEAAVAQATPGLGRDEPAYVVPTTPSPFLHSAFPPSVVPPFGTYAYGIPDMGLPPAYGEGDATQAGGEGAYDLQDVDGQYMQGMQLMGEMYDPSYGYMPYGWTPVALDGMDGMDGMDGGTAVSHGDLQDSAAQQQASADGQGICSPGDTVPSAANESREERSEKSKDAGRRGKTRVREGGREEERTERKVPGAGGTSKPENAASAGSSAGAGMCEGGGEGKDTQESGQETPSVYTTVMLRNIPNKYTREMLIKQLSVDFHGQFDFMYLPIDFKNKCNVGYGFINFRTTEACDKFIKDFHGVDVRKCLPGLNSKKVVEVTPARVQGLAENVRRLRNSPVMNQLMDHPEWMPLLFNDCGEEEPFPNPDQPLPPVKPRGRNREA